MYCLCSGPLAPCGDKELHKAQVQCCKDVNAKQCIPWTDTTTCPFTHPMSFCRVCTDPSKFSDLEIATLVVACFGAFGTLVDAFKSKTLKAILKRWFGKCWAYVCGKAGDKSTADHQPEPEAPSNDKSVVFQLQQGSSLDSQSVIVTFKSVSCDGNSVASARLSPSSSSSSRVSGSSHSFEKEKPLGLEAGSPHDAALR